MPMASMQKNIIYQGNSVISVATLPEYSHPVVIPEEIRRKLGLKAGSQFVVVGEKDTVILKVILPPSMEDFDHLIAKARQQATKAGLKRSDIAAAISNARGHK